MIRISAIVVVYIMLYFQECMFGANLPCEVCPSPPQLGCPWTWSMIVETTVGVEKPPPKWTASLLLQELVGGPTIDVSLERSASRSSITKEESLVVRLVGTDTMCPL